MVVELVGMQAQLILGGPELWLEQLLKMSKEGMFTIELATRKVQVVLQVRLWFLNRMQAQQFACVCSSIVWNNMIPHRLKNLPRQRSTIHK
jgi:hypothetical protein